MAHPCMEGYSAIKGSSLLISTTLIGLKGILLGKQIKSQLHTVWLILFTQHLRNYNIKNLESRLEVSRDVAMALEWNHTGNHSDGNNSVPCDEYEQNQSHTSSLPGGASS